MFERFTDRARRVVVLAQEEARMLQHNYIGTEHILLGLLREGDGVAAQVLVKLGAELNRTRLVVIQVLTGRPGRAATIDDAAAGLMDRLAGIVARLTMIERKLEDVTPEG
jgi:ATP-dependent Clp protease ATP-binding subunit ClpA